jgi:hypothetical protein
LAVSRALGDHFMKENQLGLISEPYVSDLIELTDEDTMLIVASDGVRQFPTHPESTLLPVWPRYGISR